MKETHEKNSKFAIKFCIFVIIAVFITIGAICLTVIKINKENILKEENIRIEGEAQRHKNEEQRNKEIAEKKRIEEEDQKYKIISYDEMYKTNSLEILYWVYDKGEEKQVSEQEMMKPEYNIKYIQINGLKNKDVQNKVNKKIRNKIFELNEDGAYINTYINANFSNILSLELGKSTDNLYEINNLNIDLNTGEEIKFEDIFLKSTSINSILVNSLYEALAWNAEIYNEEMNFIDNNMDNRDTSEYEDKFQLLINKYNKVKDNLDFSIRGDSITIYNLVDESIEKSINKRDYINLNISFADYIEEIAIYKRFIKENNIFEKDENNREVIVGTNNNDYPNGRTITYEKVNDNIFIEEFFKDSSNIDREVENKILQYIKKKTNEEKEELIKKTAKEKGVFYQVVYSLNEINDEGCYILYKENSYAYCTLNYYKKEGFKDYIKLKNKPVPDGELILFADYGEEEFKNFELSRENIECYFDSNGNFLREEKFNGY